MKTGKLLLTTFLTAMFSTLAIAADSAPNVPGESDGQLLVRVRYPDGSPAVGVKIHHRTLVLRRSNPEGVSVTDENGEFTFAFETTSDAWEPRTIPYAVRRFVVAPEGYRWEISDQYCWDRYSRTGHDQAQSTNEGGYSPQAKWFEAGYDGAVAEQDPANNWSFGKGVVVRDGDRLIWPVQLVEGESVKVAVIDQFDAPVKNADIAVGIDLKAHTRTGEGAKLAQQVVKTDDTGHFTLNHVGDYAYQFQVNGQSFNRPDYYCLKSEIDVNLLKQGTTLRFQRALSHDLQFVALDGTTGAPVPNAELCVEMQFPLFTQGGPLNVHTDEQGRAAYNEPILLEHTVWFAFRADGYEEGRFLMDDYVRGTPMRIKLTPTKP